MPRQVPSPATIAVGAGLTAAYMNANVRDTSTFLLTPPLVRIHQNTTQTLTTGTWTAISMDVTDGDSDGGHSNTVNNSRYTVQVQGWYRVTGCVAYANNHVPLVSYAVNGTRVKGAARVGNGSNAGTSTSAQTEDVVHLNVNDFVELYSFQNTGGNQATASTAEFCSVLTLEWIYSS